MTAEGSLRALVDQPTVFFVHIMKTGGVTLALHVRQQLEPSEIHPAANGAETAQIDAAHYLSVRALADLPPDRRAAIRFYAGHYPFFAAASVGQSVATMTILRDPVERTISLLRATGRGAFWRRDRTKFPLAHRPLEEVYEQEFVYEPLVHNHQTKVFSMTAQDGVDSYKDVIVVDRARLAIAKTNLATVDVVGVTERYGEFVQDVADRFGWRVPLDSKLNTAPSDDDRPVTAVFRRRIADDNALDMELHDYATNLVRERHRPA